MIKFAKIVNNETGLCSVGTGSNSAYYQSIGYTEIDVSRSDVDNQWYVSSKCPMKTDEEKAQEERNRLDLLSLTAADVERAIYQAKGMDFEDILAFIQTQAVSDDTASEIDIKALKIELKANNFYRGNPYISQIGSLLGFTEAQLDEFFESGDYTKLLEENDD